MIEQWRDIDGFPGYEVSDAGQVRSARRVFRLQRCGPYRNVVLYRALVPFRKFIHRLVLEAFRGPCPAGCEGRHLDDNHAHNSLSNLEWGTPVQNAADARRNGRIIVPAKGHRYPIGYTDRVRDLANFGISMRQTASWLGVSRRYVGTMVQP